jgi:DNA repair protein RecO (recombination protein O)
MEWRDEALLIAVRRHGESAAIIEVFTPAHGRHAGVVRGGAGRRLAPALQPGTQLDVTWRARVEDQLGAFTVEPLRSRLGLLLSDRLALAGLEAVAAILAHVLPDRLPHPGLYARTVQLLDLMVLTPAWPLAYLQWELALLNATGFGLDLSRCAVTGAREGLAYVSPRTGRAVTAAGAGDLAPRLLPLPPCLLGQGSAANAEIALALDTTGHFLERHLGPQGGDRPFPAARARLVALLSRPEPDHAAPA